MVEPRKNITEKQKSFIDERANSLLSLSQKAGVTYPALHRFYSGKTKASFETIYKIAKALDVDFEVFRAL